MALSTALEGSPVQTLLRWVVVPSSFVGTLFLCECQGLFSTAFALALGMLLIGLPHSTHLVASQRSKPYLFLARYALGGGALIAATQIPPWWRPALAALALFCWHGNKGPAAEHRVLRAMVGGTALFAVVLPALNTFPSLIAIQDGWAAFLSEAAGGLTGRSISASASVLAFDACVLFVCIGIASQISSFVRSQHVWRSVGGFVLPALGAPLVWAAVLSFLPGFDSPLQVNPEPTADPLRLLADIILPNLAIWGPVLISVALGLLLGYRLCVTGSVPAAGDSRQMGASGTRAGRMSAAVALATLIIAGGLPPWLESPPARPSAEVVLYEKGFLNWMRPSFEFFGRQSAGMFGLLPDFLESFGLNARRVSSLTDATLDGASLLFVANPEGTISQAERDAVWRFVRGGGHFLLVGEHTWRRGEQGNVLNVLLEPSQIRFRTDSANFFTGGWINGYKFLVSPITAGFTSDENDPAIVVGASLEVGPEARPMLIGGWGHSDAPALADSAGGYLGDLRFNAGEHIGDLVLMATQRVGRGRVTALGDTSPFFNGMVMTSYPFVSRLFLWAAANPPDPPFRLFFLNTALAVVVALVLAHRAGRPASVLLAGALGATLLGSFGFHRQAGWPGPFVTGDIAFVDVSHLPAHEPGIWEDDGTLALPVNMMRYGYQTHFLHNLDDGLLDKAGVLAVVAPRRTFSEEEAEQLARWVETGGTLLIAAGAEEEGPVRHLLRRFDLTFRAVPLGSVPATSEIGEAYTSEAWPLEALPGSPPLSESEVLLSWRDYPIAVRLRQGQGQVVVIADSNFFCNFNLEHEYHAHPTNVLFLGMLLPLVQQNPDRLPELRQTLDAPPPAEDVTTPAPEIQ